MIETIAKIWTQNKILLTIWIVISFLCIAILSLSPENLLVQLVSVLTQGWSAKIILILIVLSLGLLSSLIASNKNEWKKEKKKYELVKIGEGVHVFSLKKEYEASMPSHYICPKCHHENKISILVAEYTSSKESKYICPECHNFFVTNTDINNGGAFTVED